MNDVYEQLIDLLDERDIPYMSNDESRSIRTDLRGEVCVYQVVARADAEAEVFQVFGYSPLRVPQGCRPAIAEAVARANYGLRVGRFDLDVDDGQLLFHASQILVGETLSKDVIDRLIGTTMHMLDMYLPAFLSVIYGNELPEDAVRHVESSCSIPPVADGGKEDGDQ